MHALCATNAKYLKNTFGKKNIFNTIGELKFHQKWWMLYEIPKIRSLKVIVQIGTTKKRTRKLE